LKDEKIRNQLFEHLSKELIGLLFSGEEIYKYTLFLLFQVNFQIAKNNKNNKNIKTLFETQVKTSGFAKKLI